MKKFDDKKHCWACKRKLKNGEKRFCKECMKKPDIILFNIEMNAQEVKKCKK